MSPSDPSEHHEPDSEQALLTRAQIEYGEIPGLLGDWRQGIIAYAIRTWPQAREPYKPGTYALPTDGIEMPLLVADAADHFMEVIEENLSADVRKALVRMGR